MINDVPNLPSKRMYIRFECTFVLKVDSAQCTWFNDQWCAECTFVLNVHSFWCALGECTFVLNVHSAQCTSFESIEFFTFGYYISSNITWVTTHHNSGSFQTKPENGSVVCPSFENNIDISILNYTETGICSFKVKFYHVVSKKI